MKRFCHFSMLYALLLLLLNSSCKKAIDYIKDHPELTSCCRIEQLDYRFLGGEDEPYRAVFTYNKQGNPVSIEHPDIEIAFDMNHYFKYDKYGRLTAYAQTYLKGSSGFIICDKYSYPDRHTIIDSTLLYGDGWPDNPVGDPETPVEVTVLKLDNFGRVITGNKYDKRGNLIYPGVAVEYDSAVNLRQTHPLWMFLDKNYSKNNIRSQVYGGYNSFGFPLGFRAIEIEGRFSSFLNLLMFNGAIVTYSCKDDGYKTKYQVDN
ncbi:hypothetical protein [Foetidibacter luteolus]|uniref:hypothetical protein n=1 Tax=Foetidibacter luteolus TaxID=2608880 RepID=UPI00129A92FC|nr:hypothetical protein [Foetidibacter luteolus]